MNVLLVLCMPQLPSIRAARDFRVPLADFWNFSVQHQIQPTLTVEAAYVGNVGRPSVLVACGLLYSKNSEPRMLSCGGVMARGGDDGGTWSSEFFRIDSTLL